MITEEPSNQGAWPWSSMEAEGQPEALPLTLWAHQELLRCPHTEQQENFISYVPF